jgi:hypothetical protein
MRRFEWTMKVLAPCLALAIAVGCSPKEEELPPVPAKPVVKKAAPPAPVPAGTPTPVAPPPTPKIPVTAPAPTAAEIMQKAEEAVKYAKIYESTNDFNTRVDAIYHISDLNTAEAIATLGAIFQKEKEVDLKVEVVDSLFDFDGLDDQKVAILAAAAAPNQEQEVREAAIEALTDVEPRKAMPIVQGLVNDSNADIRDAAKDALEQLQDALNNP